MRHYTLFEVWTEDEDGHQELVETTADKRLALRIAKESKKPGLTVVVYEETDDGDLQEIEVF